MGNVNSAARKSRDDGEYSVSAQFFNFILDFSCFTYYNIFLENEMSQLLKLLTPKPNEASCLVLLESKAKTFSTTFSTAALKIATFSSAMIIALYHES